MNIQSILKRKGQEVVNIVPQAKIEIAAHLMRIRNVGALVVTDGTKVVGMLFSRDIVDAFSRHGWRLCDLAVADVMRSDFVSITPEHNVKDVMALMTRDRTTHMPVLTSGRLAGLISIGDIVKHRLEELELEKNVIRDAYIAVH